MKRIVILTAIGTVMLAGLAGAAYAQQSGANASTPSNFKYEIQGNKHVDRPDSRTVAADGTATLTGSHTWATPGSWIVRVLVGDSRNDTVAEVRVTVT